MPESPDRPDAPAFPERPLTSALCSLSSILWLLPLAFLWWTLINHLRVEWTVNPQYNYGWAVPFLCAYLLWRNNQPLKVRSSNFKVQGSSPLPISAFCFLFSILAFAFPLARLVQEANPEWRLVSWALALITVGLTLLLVRHFSVSVFQRFSFPLCFFLVSVPWPTVIEGPIIQKLAAFNAVAAAEILNLFGVPALRHGNVIEIGTGFVGVEDACSGIRSFQACLMIGLFLGAYYQLRARRHVVLVLAGFSLAILFNLGRTVLLVVIAARKGTDAIAQWHDPAGVTILIGCFLGVWALASWFHRHCSAGSQPASSESIPAPVPTSDLRLPTSPPTRSLITDHRSTEALKHRNTAAFALPLALTAWLFLCEVGVELWYRRNEAALPARHSWTVQLPTNSPAFREVSLDPRVLRMLRFDEARNAVWTEPDGSRVQAIFQRWEPGRIAVHLARSHTPEVCLTSAGHKLTGGGKPFVVPAGDVQLTFDVYHAKDEDLWVFYCLREDGDVPDSNETESLSYRNRLAPVLAGRRNLGQRSLEIAIWSRADPSEVQAKTASIVQSIVVNGDGQ